MGMTKFLNNPVALIKDEVVSEVVYMLDRTDEEIKQELSNHEYDYFIFFNDYGFELFVGQEKIDDKHFAFSKPYPSWIFDEDGFFWKAPVDFPQDQKAHIWNEENQSWDLCNIC